MIKLSVEKKVYRTLVNVPKEWIPTKSYNEGWSDTRSQNMNSVNLSDEEMVGNG